MSFDPTLVRTRDLPVRFGRYTLRALLGEGGMGRVFHAELEGAAGFRKDLAIKVLRSAALARGRDDFIREARLGGLLKHPNLVDVYELDEHEGTLYLVMELVRGVSLSAALRQRAIIPPLAALQIGRQICVALSHAHGLRVQGRPAGLVHSDLKPANVLLGRDGLVKLADLGVAWAAGLFGELPAGQQRGTLSWMAPEQLEGGSVDHRADLFALGTILATSTLGHHPFRRSTQPATAAAIMEVDRLIEDQRLGEQLDVVLPGLGEVVVGCLAHDPGRRPPTAGALAAMLGALIPRARQTPGLALVLSDLLPDLAEDELVSAGTGSLIYASSSFWSGALGDGPRSNIEPAHDAFVGREAEYRRLASLFDGGARLVTLKAAGGIGKTRLARRYASGAADSLRGGAWFAGLLEVRTPMGIRHAVGEALGLQGSQEDSLDGIADALQQRGPTLLVLDNAEHIIDEVANQASRWLAEVPSLVLLVTSRQPLGLPAERVVEIGSLSTEEGVALFRERAVRSAPGWSPDPDDLDRLPELVERLDGLPLAIELAAARAGTLPIRELVARLGQRFQLLAPRPGRDGDRTLGAAIAWSWEQITSWEQAALSQLTVFVGGFTLDEAEVVISLQAWPDAGWAIDVVEELARNSMLTSRSVDGRPRYDMYETIRHWAAERLDARELEAARRRHARAFARLGTRDAISALSRRGGGLRGRRLVRELQNLVAACDNAVALGEVEAAAGACAAAVQAIERAGSAPFAEEIVAKVLALPDLGDIDRARLLLSSGWLRRRTSFASAERRLERSRRLAAKVGDRRLALEASLALGRLRMASGNDAGLARGFEELAWELEDLGELGGAGRARGYQGGVLFYQGRVKEARRVLEEAAGLLQEHADRGSELDVRFSIARLEMTQGRLDEAEREFQRSLRLSRNIESRFFEGVAIGNLGVLEMTRQDGAAARPLLRAAARIHRQVGARAQEGVCQLNLGQILLEEGDLIAARGRLERGARLCRSTWTAGAGSALSMLAALSAREGKHAQAADEYARAEAILRGVDREEEGKLLARGAEVAALAGELGQARERLDAARGIRDAMSLQASSDLAQLIAATETILARVTPEPKPPVTPG